MDRAVKYTLLLIGLLACVGEIVNGVFTGLWLLVFLIIHVRAFRFGAHYVSPDGMNDLYRVEMEQLKQPLMMIFYVLSMLVVGSHVFHGASSAFQSLGLSHPSWTPRILAWSKALAVMIAGGFIVIALWAYFLAGQVRV